MKFCKLEKDAINIFGIKAGKKPMVKKIKWFSKRGSVSLVMLIEKLTHIHIFCDGHTFAKKKKNNAQGK